LVWKESEFGEKPLLVLCQPRQVVACFEETLSASIAHHIAGLFNPRV
jgi:hypothetical protein